MISTYLKRLADKFFEDNRNAIQRLACTDAGGESEKFISGLCGEMGEKYIRYRQGKRTALRPEVLEKYQNEIAEASQWLRETAMEYYFSVRRKVEVARIEYPLLSYRLSVEMPKKGIPYLFVAKGSENVLTVQVVWEHFYDIPLSLDNFDRVMSMLKYCIARPEYALEEIPEIRKRRSYTLRDSWNRVASSGNDQRS